MISNVYFVPKLRSNIMSLGQLLERGCEILMKNNYLWLRDQNTNLLAKFLCQRTRCLL